MTANSSKLSQPLSATERAQLYHQFRQLEAAGMPFQTILTQLAQAQSPYGHRAKRALAYFNQGKSLPEAGIKAGLFMGLDAGLMKAAELGGIYTQVLQQLEDLYTQKARNQRRITTRLGVPLLILILALIIQPLPALISGSLSLTSYFATTIGLMITVGVLLLILWRLPYWARYGFLQPTGLGLLLDSLEVKLPYWRHWHTRRYMRHFMHAFGLMLQAGLPLIEALMQAAQLVENARLRRQLRHIPAYLQRGYEITEALAQLPGINPQTLQLIHTGEHSGSLAEMVLRYAQLEAEVIEAHNQMLIEWLPRLLYLLIALWIAWGLVNSFTTPAI